MPSEFQQLEEWEAEQIPANSMSPIDELIAQEELLSTAARTETGQLEVDPDSGKVKRVPVLVLGQYVPIEPRSGKEPKRKRKARVKVEPPAPGALAGGLGSSPGAATGEWTSKADETARPMRKTRRRRSA